ncbi:hypothetical protein CBS101457_004083 [Exobasidium rhododendri]|nr:hypothetical protein CBS101457_004083 [Exobasidium rhododendri]
MRAVLQRVTGATVHVDGKLISKIGPGIVALVGIGTDDTVSDVVPLCQKILTTKLWNEGVTAKSIVVPPQYEHASTSDQQSLTPHMPMEPQQDDQNGSQGVVRSEQVWGGKPWKTNVMDLEGEVLCISQFTLHARLTKGTKPDFHRSMGGEQAKEIYSKLLERLCESYQSERIKGESICSLQDVFLSRN